MAPTAKTLMWYGRRLASTKVIGHLRQLVRIHTLGPRKLRLTRTRMMLVVQMKIPAGASVAEEVQQTLTVLF